MFGGQVTLILNLYVFIPQSSASQNSKGPAVNKTVHISNPYCAAALAPTSLYQLTRTLFCQSTRLEMPWKAAGAMRSVTFELCLKLESEAEPGSER
ncbi:hypothetical protein Plhal304r1_c001g0001571 [Plasmopara halstedii]